MEVIIIVVILVVIGLDVLYIKNYKAVRNLKYKIQIKHSNNVFNRDIDTEYSPSIISYLYNQKIEPEKDLVADILNLYARKIIDIEEDDGVFNIKLVNSEYQLSENDEYIIDTIILKEKDFKYEEWISKIIKEYRTKLNIKDNLNNITTDKNKDYIKTIKKRKNNQEIWIVLGTIALIPFALIMAALTEILGINFIIYFALIVFLSIICIQIVVMIKKSKKRDEKIDMHLTKEAQEELKKWMRLENFIKSYTLLKDRNFEEIELFEKYIPYAMVLNINKKYKEELIRVLGKEEVKLFIESVNKYKRINNIFVQYSC